MLKFITSTILGFILGFILMVITVAVVDANNPNFGPYTLVALLFWLVASSGWSDSGLWARFYYCHGCSFDLFYRQRQADGADAVV